MDSILEYGDVQELVRWFVMQIARSLAVWVG